MRYGAKVLFDDVTTTFLAGRRYGLTGPNGSGKSTFMKVLTGELDAQKGTVVRPKRVGVLSQDQFAFDAFRVVDTVIMGNRPLWQALEERDRLYSKEDMTDEDGMRLGELEGIVAENDGYTAESDAAILLDGLDIPEPLHERKMSDPSAKEQLAKGFYALESGAWRWTAGNFSAVLKTPPGAAQKGATLTLALVVSDAVLKQVHSQSLTAAIAGKTLKSENYQDPGGHTFTADIPAVSLTGDTVTVDFSLDNSLPPGPSDRRELGVIVTAVGVETN